MREPQSRAIGPCKYIVTPLGASAGLRVLTILLRVFGPALDSVKSFGDVEAAVLLGLRSITERLDGADLEAVQRALAEQTLVELSPGKQPKLSAIFDHHFAGDYLPLFQWLVFALEVNYASFFRELIAKGAVAKQPEAPAAA